MSPHLRNFFKLLCWAVGLWIFFAILTPIMVDHVPAWKRYNQIQEEQDLDSGALYYSNVPQTFEAEINMRRAVEEGMNIRREKAVRERAQKENAN